MKPANSQQAEAPARPHKPKTLHKKSIVQNTAEPAKPHASKAARAAEINAKAHVRHATLSAKAVPPAKAEPQPRQETRSQAPLDKKAVDLYSKAKARFKFSDKFASKILGSLSSRR